MQFSDITKAVHDAWTFSWPPLVMCAIAYLVSRHLNAAGTGRAIESLTANIKAYGVQLDSARSLLEPYGITTLIPIVSAVAVIGFLYILNGPITILASKLPPHVSYSPDTLLSRSMSDQEKLVLLRKYPAANGFNAAYYMALQEHSPTQTSNRAELNYKIGNFIKFALLAALVLLVVNVIQGVSVGSQLLRFMLLLLLLAPLWCVNFVSLLRNQENQFHHEWAAVRVQLLADSRSLLEKEQSQMEKEVFEALSRDRGRRWWRVYLFDPHAVTWFRYTFFPQRDG